MKRMLPRPTTLAAAAAIGAAALVSGAPLATAVVTDQVHIQAQATVTGEAPEKYTAPVTDYSGALDTTQSADLTDKIQQYKIDAHKSIFVVFLPSFGTMSPEQWTERAMQLNGGGNTVVMAVATEDRQFGIKGGSDWPQSEVDRMTDAAYPHLAGSDWFAAADAAVEAAATSGEMSGESLAWLGGGAAAAVAAGGGIYVYSRRKREQNSAAVLEDSRAIEPSDTRRLASLPMETLEQLAKEELVSTDESIRRGREELDLAIAEFGPERTRSFTRAMNHSTTTLQKAFALQQRLNDSIPETEAERRSMLVTIVSSCGQADDALDSESAAFAEMRNLLATADQKIDELTRRTVDLRTRLPRAEEQLEALRSRYSEESLESIDHNVTLAGASLDEAEKSLTTARELAARPAGEQGGLVEAIRDTEHAVQVADRMLGGIERADENIAAAQAGVGDLLTEVENEIREAGDLKRRGISEGARADWQKLDDVVVRAIDVVEKARSASTKDPLGAYTLLTDIDAELDEQLDRVRETTADQSRQLQILDQQLQTAGSSIQAAEDFIASRGRVVQAESRTLLADAKRLHAQALQLRTSDTRQAIDHARQAAAKGRSALQRAQSDYNDYQRRQQMNYRGRGGGSGMGGIVTGMLINEILSGGGRGGGFGGGFGGGGGGGFRGGSF